MRILFPIFVALFYYFIIFFITYWLFNYVSLDFLKNTNNSIMLEILPYAIVLMIGLIHHKYKKNFNPNIRRRFISNFSSILIVTILIAFTRVVNDPIYRIKDIMNDKSNFVGYINSTHLSFSWIEYYLLIFQTIIFIPIVEEFFFRGIILNNLLKTGDYLTSIIISSFLFSLIHYNYFDVSYISIFSAFVFGLVCGFIYLNFGMVFSVFAHSLYNLIWFVLSLNSQEYFKIIEYFSFNLYYWLIVIFVLMILLFIVCKISLL